MSDNIIKFPGKPVASPTDADAEYALFEEFHGELLAFEQAFQAAKFNFDDPMLKTFASDVAGAINVLMGHLNSIVMGNPKLREFMKP